MPEFLVRIDVSLPHSLPREEVERLVAAERVRGRELVAAGSIRRIWRLPGGIRNVGVWSAADATELHDLLTSLPLAQYISTQVEALAVHPLEADAGD
jgi:muconolactone D-isomerase